jgi:integrase
VERQLEAMRRKHGDAAPLFDNLTEYEGKRRKDATNRLGKWLRTIKGLNLADDQSFYSFRHTVVSELERYPDKVSQRMADFITGHAGGGNRNVKTKHYYHPAVEDVRRAIELLPNPFAARAMAA